MPWNLPKYGFWKKALDILIPKLIGLEHTYKVHPYKGFAGVLPT
jgi:hypothetical protein